MGMTWKGDQIVCCLKETAHKALNTAMERFIGPMAAPTEKILWRAILREKDLSVA